MSTIEIRQDSLERAIAESFENGRVSGAAEERARLYLPEVEDFLVGVDREAAHQRDRWSSEHDAGKTPEDWFWLVGFLAGKCLRAALFGDREKALHHTISTAAALANWHAALLGKTDMRPGIGTPKGETP